MSNQVQEDLWLPSLATETPQSGFELAVKLARTAVKAAQPDSAVRNELRADYDHDAAHLIAVSQVVGVYFQTVAAANDHWR